MALKMLPAIYPKHLIMLRRTEKWLIYKGKSINAWETGSETWTRSLLSLKVHDRSARQNLSDALLLIGSVFVQHIPYEL